MGAMIYNSLAAILIAICGGDSEAAELNRNRIDPVGTYPRNISSPAYDSSATARDKQLYHLDGRTPQVRPRSEADARVLLRDSGEARKHERLLEDERRNTYRHY